MCKHVETRLFRIQFKYLFALASKSVATRPICRSTNGGYFTPQKILQLLNQTGSMETEPEFPPPIARTDDLQMKLEQAGERLLHLRTELSYYLLTSAILPAIQDEEVRAQRIRRRGNDLQLTVGCVCLCPSLFASHFNTTKALIKLLKINDDHDGGLFQKTGKLTKNSFVSRNFADLFFITSGDGPLPSNDWIPTFSFQDILREESLEMTENFSGQQSALEYLEKEGLPDLENKDKEEPFYVDVSKKCQPPPLPEQAPKSRFGRTLKPPSFYQS